MRLERFKEATELFKLAIRQDPRLEWKASLANAYTGRAVRKERYPLWAMLTRHKPDNVATKHRFRLESAENGRPYRIKSQHCGRHTNLASTVWGLRENRAASRDHRCWAAERADEPDLCSSAGTAFWRSGQASAVREAPRLAPLTLGDCRDPGRNMIGLLQVSALQEGGADECRRRTNSNVRFPARPSQELAPRPQPLAALATAPSRSGIPNLKPHHTQDQRYIPPHAPSNCSRTRYPCTLSILA
jgi:hypothetical protein